MNGVNYFKVIPAEILTVKADKDKSISVFGYEQEKVDLFEKRTAAGIYKKILLGNVKLFFVISNIAEASFKAEKTLFKFKNGAELFLTGDYTEGLAKPKRKPRKTAAKVSE